MLGFDLIPEIGGERLRGPRGRLCFRGRGGSNDTILAVLRMTTSSMIGVLFLAIAVIFFAISLRDSIHRERRLAQRVRLRVGIIFTLVGVGLQVVHWLLGY